jgi:hypothetical protein
MYVLGDKNKEIHEAKLTIDIKCNKGCGEGLTTL